MKFESFNETLKCKLDQLKEETLYLLITKDKEYQKLSENLILAEENYQALELTPEQKSMINHLITSNDSYNMEYSTLNYIAGLIDGQKIGLLISPASADTARNAEAIRKFYYDIFRPCVEQCKTPETLESLKILSEQEKKFISTLTSEQAADFKALHSKTEKTAEDSMADSFVHGFQLGTKILMSLLD